MQHAIFNAYRKSYDRSRRSSRGGGYRIPPSGNGLTDAAPAVLGDRILHHAPLDRFGRSPLTASFVLLGIFFNERYFISCVLNSSFSKITSFWMAQTIIFLSFIYFKKPWDFPSQVKTLLIGS
jgi:hypothetical protein